jgi:hypothetical protein
MPIEELFSGKEEMQVWLMLLKSAASEMQAW